MKALRNKRIAARLMRQFILDRLSEHSAISTEDLLRWFRAQYGQGYKATALQAKIAVMEREGVIRRESRGILVHCFAKLDPNAVFQAKYPSAVDTLQVLVKRDRLVRVAELPLAFLHIHGRVRNLPTIMVDLRRLKAAELAVAPRHGYVRATEKGERMIGKPDPSIFD